jgi:alpha-D-xyloside xylohydrolase
MSRLTHVTRTLPLLLGLAAPVVAQWAPPNPVETVQHLPDGAEAKLQKGYLRLQVCTDSIIHVVYSLQRTVPRSQDFILTKTTWSNTSFWLDSSDAKTITLSTAKLKIVIDRASSSLVFQDADGKPLAEENTRSLEPVEVNGERTFHAERFVNMWGTQEAFYGLGQHQAGTWNYRGEAIDISQDNTNLSIPMLLSSSGYGILWNNGSRSRFNNRFPHAFYLSSEVADAVDYFFLYGPEFDTIVAAYRTLTGAAPLFGQWAYGYWQCKNRYASQQEILSIAHRYRELHIPLDNIVQDWFWWNIMGEPVFNENFPDPKGMVDELHKANVHLMISIWPYFRPGSSVYTDLERRRFFIDKTKAPSFHPVGQALYDAFNPDARKYYWRLIDDALFKIGLDAWWMDTTEPETEGRETNILVTNSIALGNGARYANEFPVATTSAVYEGQRSESDKKRVFILSRSGYAGIQRNAVAVWSGDVNPNWETFRRQIPAGLNLSVSGVPYWTTDIGGFVSANPDDPAYRELYVRWFEFGTFCPIFRAHGTRTTNQNEIWSYGPEAQKILTSYDRLRYRLLPYIYSLAWRVTSAGYTIMRPLVMDFRMDIRAQNIGDEYLFGPAILVAPVTEPEATTRHIYLPKARWYDFWTGKTFEGGRSTDVSAPLDVLPLLVRAGSIIPLGPDKEFAAEKVADPIELRIYPGASGDFVLYEDEGDNYNYEKGAHATIGLHWDDANKVLTLDDRQGSFPQMLESRTFHVVFVRENHGAGAALTSNADKTVTYLGKRMTVTP